MKKTICVIGKGHSGTGFLATILKGSGVYMGKHTNRDMDKGPFDNIYRIMSLPVGCRQGAIARHKKSGTKYARYVKAATDSVPNIEWDFSGMVNGSIPHIVRYELKTYIEDLKNITQNLVGWKLTESNLIYPWLVRLYPDWYYIHLVRDVRDMLKRPELTDTDSHTDLFNVEGYTSRPNKHKFPGNNLVRALNWKYQLDIVKSIETPNYIRITLEDLVMSHGEVIKKLSDFLGFEVNPGRPKKEVVESWRGKNGKGRENWEEFSFLNDYMEELKYSEWPLFGDNKEYRRK